METDLKLNEEEILGTGRNGTIVYKGKFRDRDVAVKKIIQELDSTCLQEIEILRSCGHENVMVFIGTMATNKFTLIVMELCDFTLKQLVKEKSVDMCPVEILKQVTLGVEWLHAQGIVHMNINPDNILVLVVLKKIKIGGFGAAKYLAGGFGMHCHCHGVLGFVAPELLARGLELDSSVSKVSKQIDIFALGCVYYYVLTDGKNPFGDELRCQGNVLRGHSIIRFKDLKYTCCENGLFMQLMISSNAEVRPSCAWLLRCPIFWSQETRVRFLQQLKENCEPEFNQIRTFKTRSCAFEHLAETASLKGKAMYHNPCAIPFAYLNHELRCNTAGGGVNKKQIKQNVQLEVNCVEDSTNNVVKKFSWGQTDTSESKTQGTLARMIEKLEKLDFDCKLVHLRIIIRKEDFETIKIVMETTCKSKKVGEIWGHKAKSLLIAAVNNYETFEYLINTQGLASILCTNESELINAILINKSHDNVIKMLELVFKLNPETVDSRDDTNTTPLISVITENQYPIELIKMLLSYNTNVNAVDTFGVTPLIAAVKAKHELVVLKLLIESGADVEAVDKSGNDFITFAASNLHPKLFHEVVLYLVNVGKTNVFNARRDVPFINFLVKIMEPIRDTLELFKKIGLKFDGADGKGYNILFFAVAGQRSVQFIQMLMEYFNDHECLDKTGSTLLHHAAEHGNLGSVRFCFLLNIDVNEKNKLKDIALHNACRRETPDLNETHYIIKNLLEHASDANARNIVSMYPICFARTRYLHGKMQLRTIAMLVNATLAGRGGLKTQTLEYGGVDEKELKHLIELSGDWEDLNDFNETVLHHAAETGNLFAVKLFIALGFDVNAKDVLGRTPIDLVRDSRFGGNSVYKQIVDVLRNNGGKITDNTQLDVFMPFPFMIMGSLFQLAREEVTEAELKKVVAHDPNAVVKEKPAIVASKRDKSITPKMDAKSISVKKPNVQEARKIKITLELWERLDKKGKGACIRSLVACESLSVINGVLIELAKTVRINGIWSKKYKSPLHVAVLLREFDVFEYLVYTHDFKSVLATDKFKITILCQCIHDIPNADMDSKKFYNRIKMLELLFKIVPELVNSMGDDLLYTPLHFATCMQFQNQFQMHFIQVLLKHNADVNAVDINRLTPLHLIFKCPKKVSESVVDIIKVLVKKRANLGAVDSNGDTFMHFAPLNTSPQLFHRVVMYVASVDPGLLSAVNKHGRSVLSNTLLSFEPLNETLKIFKNHGVDFNAVDKDGDSVFFYAIGSGKSGEFLTQLIQLGADYTIRNYQMDNAVHVAVFFGTLSTLKKVIALGCDVNARNFIGDTPLHIALKRIQDVHEFVKELINHGANVRALNYLAITPLHIANTRICNGELSLPTLMLLLKAHKTNW